MSFFRRLGLFAGSRPILLSLLGLPFVLLLTPCTKGAPSATNAQATPATAPQDGAAAQGAATARGTGRATGRGGRGGETGAIPVSTAKALEMSLPLEVQGVGNVEANSTVEIRSQVTGPLLTVDFIEGQDVTDGQLLFTIDPRPFEVAVRQAEAVLAKDTGQSKTAEAQRARYASLFKNGLASQADL